MTEEFKKSAYKQAKKFALGNDMAETACQLMADWAYEWLEDYYAIKCAESSEQWAKTNVALKKEADKLAEALEDLIIEVDSKEHCYFVNTDKQEQALREYRGEK